MTMYDDELDDYDDKCPICDGTGICVICNDEDSDKCVCGDGSCCECEN